MPSARPLLAVSYATVSPDAAAQLVARDYDISGAITCSLIHRGFNDVYAVTLATGERYVLRLGGHRGRQPDVVAAETAFLAYLDAAGVPVAAAAPTREGALFTEAAMPDGVRHAVLFRHAEGRRPDLDLPEDARVQGAALARVHNAADDWPLRESGRHRLDLEHLLHRQVAAVLALDLDAPQARPDLLALAQRLAATVAGMDDALTRTRGHGDCHGLNARIAHAGHAILFDFDDSGFGYLAYDLAVHLWAQLSFGRTRYPMWHAFERGYRSVRPLRREDEAALPIFVAIRHIWLMGEYAVRVAEWGEEMLSASWLEREVAWLLNWERDRLSPSLL